MLWKAMKKALMAKGVMRRLAPYNPVKVRPHERTNVESWIGGYGNNPKMDRQKIPKASKASLRRGLHKIMSYSQTRRNPQTNEPEILLHRGMSRDEHHANTNSKIFSSRDHSSWTPLLTTAHGFARDYARFSADDGLDDQANVVSSWVPISAVHHVPLQIGSTAREFDNDARLGETPRRSNRRNELEVIVGAGSKLPIHDRKDVESNDSMVDTYGHLAAIHHKNIKNQANVGGLESKRLAVNDPLQTPISERQRMPRKLAASESIAKAKEDKKLPAPQRQALRQQRREFEGVDKLQEQLTTAPGVSARGIEARRGDARVEGAIGHGYARAKEPEKHMEAAKRGFKKSNYGPRGAQAYDLAANVGRKMSRTGEELDIGPNKAVRYAGPSSRQQVDAKVLEFRRRSKKNPVKTYSPKEIGAYKQKTGFKTKLAASEMEKGAKGDWEKEGYKFKASQTKSPMTHTVMTKITAHHPSGKLAGTYHFADDPSTPGHIYAVMSETHPQHQRKGLANAAYDLAQKKMKKPVEPSTAQSTDAKKFWANRLAPATTPKLEKQIKLEHYSPQQDLKEISPKFEGGGADKRVYQNRKDAHPRSYFYRAGTEPEHIVTSPARSKYTIDLPSDKKIYDLGTDPDGIQARLHRESLGRQVNPGVVEADDKHAAIKAAGYHGFMNSTGQLPNVVALYGATPVSHEKKL
jgi:hypothetical protein